MKKNKIINWIDIILYFEYLYCLFKAFNALNAFKNSNFKIKISF